MQRSDHRSKHMCFTVQIAQTSILRRLFDGFDPAHFRWLYNIFLTIALRIEGFMICLLHFHFHFVINTSWTFRFWVHLSKRHYKVIHFEGVCFGSLGDPSFSSFCWSLAGLMPDWCFYLPLEPSLEVSRAPLASFSYKLHYINQKLWLNIHWTSIKHLCLPGRPDSRMYCPDIIGRDSWVWDEQKALYKTIPPTGWGSKRSRQGLSTHW